MLARLRKSTEENDGGFTLIELLVVIIIIGILAAIAIPTFLNQRKKGYSASAQSALKNAATAQESFLTEGNAYGTTVANLTAQGYNPSANVTLAVVNTVTSHYCMTAVHSSDSSVTWAITNQSAGTMPKGTPYKVDSTNVLCSAT